MPKRGREYGARSSSYSKLEEASPKTGDMPLQVLRRKYADYCDLRRRAALMPAATTPIPATRASTSVGDSGESAQPVCARAGNTDAKSKVAARRLRRRNIINLFKTVIHAPMCRFAAPIATSVHRIHTNSPKTMLPRYHCQLRTWDAASDPRPPIPVPSFSRFLSLSVP